jgi:hypothetical protein
MCISLRLMGRYSQGLIIPEGPGKVKQGLPDFRPKSSQAEAASGCPQGI